MNNETIPWLAVVTMTWGGVSGKGRSPNGCKGSLSGCGALAATLAEYALDGARVIIAPDERGPMASAWIHGTICGPMLDPDLPPKGCDRFDKAGARNSIIAQALIADFAEGSGNEYGGILAVAVKAPDTWGGLDYVGLDIWLDVKRTAGARVGTYRRASHSIDWEDGTSTACPAPPAPGGSWWHLWDWQKSLIPHPGPAEV